MTGNECQEQPDLTREMRVLQKYLESYKQEPIGIAKPADWFDFDEYERIQLPTVRSPLTPLPMLPLAALAPHTPEQGIGWSRASPAAANS